MPGKGEVVLAEGDPELSEDEERLIEEFRRQLDSGMWAAVPITEGSTGRREAIMVKDYSRHPAGRRASHLLPARRGRLSRPLAVSVGARVSSTWRSWPLALGRLPRVGRGPARGPPAPGPPAARAARTRTASTREPSGGPSGARARC